MLAGTDCIQVSLQGSVAQAGCERFLIVLLAGSDCIQVSLQGGFAQVGYGGHSLCCWQALNAAKSFLLQHEGASAAGWKGNSEKGDGARLGGLALLPVAVLELSAEALHSQIAHVL